MSRPETVSRTLSRERSPWVSCKRGYMKSLRQGRTEPSRDRDLLGLCGRAIQSPCVKDGPKPSVGTARLCSGGKMFARVGEHHTLLGGSTHPSRGDDFTACGASTAVKPELPSVASTMSCAWLWAAMPVPSDFAPEGSPTQQRPSSTACGLGHVRIQPARWAGFDVGFNLAKSPIEKLCPVTRHLKWCRLQLRGVLRR